MIWLLITDRFILIPAAIIIIQTDIFMTPFMLSTARLLWILTVESFNKRSATRLLEMSWVILKYAFASLAVIRKTWKWLILTFRSAWFLMTTQYRQVPGHLQAQPLRWRHNGHNSVSNHQPHDCLLNSLFRRRSKKTSKLRVTEHWAVNSPGTGDFPAQMASYVEIVSIWWRHHGWLSSGPTPKRSIEPKCIFHYLNDIINDIKGTIVNVQINSAENAPKVVVSMVACDALTHLATWDPFY